MLKASVITSCFLAATVSVAAATAVFTRASTSSTDSSGTGLSAGAAGICGDGNHNGRSDDGGGGGDDGGGGGSGGGGGGGGGGPVSASYNIQVAGAYSGNGSATLTGASLQISANIRDGSGNTGTLQSTITIANGRFSGTGTAMGQPFTLSGRLDPADSPARQQSVIRAARIVSTFTTAAGLHGRIAGEPTTATCPN